MTDQINQDIINDIGIQLANKIIEASEYKSRLIAVQGELDGFRAVLARNDELRAKFEEEQAKGGNQQ
ncbi:hypothetical protein D8821_10635 [Streptococcus gordonii]|uniref:hypothetical protein n=1 Tax=Streptococcus gordonii TaxID=1302 RepID=UPI000F679F0E|nr:hypothetical protein [Streptococcus gordonii]RSJ32904.1 hypothetical protein D8821_10635 [Streptococcus gordonii]